MAPSSLAAMAQTSSSSKLLLLALAPAWLSFLWVISKAQWFWSNRPDLHFGWIVPLLCLFLFSEHWANRPESRFRFTAFSGLLAAAGLALLLFSQLVQAAFGLVASGLLMLFFGAIFIITANLEYVFGFKGIRLFLFSFSFLFVALPIPSGAYNLIVNTLQLQITNLNVEILALLGIPAQKMGSLIQLPNGVVGVDEACSGIRSLQSTIMATVFIGCIGLRRFSLKLVLFLSGLLFAFLGNVGRSLFLSLTANAKGLKAIDNVHDTAGWSVFAVNGVAIILTAWLLSKLQRWLDKHASPNSALRSAPAPELQQQCQS